tara:strand:+ start:1219 stop:1425 length:207 start_codon:yes stop_codon:yes gene_type:complete
MISYDSMVRIFVILTVLSVDEINLFAGLDPAIKIFIGVVALAGPLSIAGVVFLLKNIEKNDPDRIRWK